MGYRRGKKSPKKASNELDILQGDADFLIEIEKTPLDPGIPIKLTPGMNLEVDFENKEYKEKFRVIIQRTEKVKGHAKFELLARNCIVLLRYEIKATPHTNPDGEVIPCPHLHRYRENYGDAWAERTGEILGDPDNLVESLRKFLQYCNAVQLPPINEERRLFL